MNDFHVVFAEGKHRWYGTRGGTGSFRYEYKCRFCLRAALPSNKYRTFHELERHCVADYCANLVSYRADIAENLSITETDMGIVATKGVPVVVYDFVLPRFASVSP